ncbi:Nn.00g111550.m01.CDS01 [Neocucurbitaria sp. VM-36]
MNDPPGTIPAGSAQQHPRRPPAHKSVSLRHSPPATGAGSKGAVKRQPTAHKSHNAASNKAKPSLSVSPTFLSTKHSSGESSDAGKWFETTNNNAKQSKVSFADNEPPFFLRNSSSSETPPETSHYNHAHSAIPYRPGLTHLGTDGGSTEEFRSVIDDLTVANKKLKQKLKKYEKLYNAHLSEEKLFEIRFHGLPDHKKKELEETLRKFATDLDDGSGADYPPVSSYAPALEAQKTASSTSRFAESGYASLSASGQASSALSNQDQNRKVSRSQYNRQQENVQSYLHDIPLGLLPQKHAPMTEKSKKKLVARRLEQIFAGKRSAPGNHQQPLQQEEVAQSAATADREERQATGKLSRPEGLRVARIMSGGRDVEDVSQSEATRGLRSALGTGEEDFTGSGSSPDQRPTRPLDLDLYRAQVSGENMDYIRHLGFTPPDMVSGEAPTDGHGWLYLNLLINMAQLHTLNVTPEFVKDAVHDYSSHLEISRDGRKIRWKGGLDVTKHSGESSSEHYSGTSPSDIALSSRSPSGHLKTSHSGASREVDSEQRARKLARAKKEKEQHQFNYKPIFFHKEDSDEDEDYYGLDAESSGNSIHLPRTAGNSSALLSSGMQSSSSKPRRDDGPMIFYTKAKFCTDLSGDRLGASLANPAAYNTITGHALGAASDTQSSAQQSSEITEPRGPLDTSPMDMDSSNSSRAISSDEDFGFSPASLKHDSSNDNPDVMDFEASGLGGVQPEDNFAIQVRRSQVQTTSPRAVRPRESSFYPQKILDVLAERPSAEHEIPSSVIKEEILSASRKSLPSSTLPPASFLPFDSTSSGDVDSDLDSDASSTADSESGEGPATGLQLLNISPAGGDSSAEEVDESDFSDSSDGSVDLLATARQLDPKTVRASEREYDAALADRLAEIIPAGSSAATAGGGSGFNSPDDKKEFGAGAMNPTQDSVPRNKSQSITSGSASSRVKNLKRARTSDSVTTVPKHGKGSKSQKMK